MKRVRAACAAACALAPSCAAPEPFLPDPRGWTSVVAEEFDAPELPPRWTLESPGTRRDATNTVAAVSVADGVLSITTSTEAGVHETAMLSTRHSFAQAYGCFEARIAFDTQPGMWSAFWLYADPPAIASGDARVDGIEADIAEHRALDRAGEPLAGRTTMALHWRDADANLQSAASFTPELALDRGFHVYTLVWSPVGYEFHVDGAPVWALPGLASARPQFVVLGSEVEAAGWAGPIPPAGYGARGDSKARMRVDWVRVYARER